MLMVAIKDRAIEVFSTPIFVHSIAQAMRLFRDEINDEKSAMQKHPEDYELWEVGYFNEQTGDTGGSPEIRARGQDVREPVQQ